MCVGVDPIVFPTPLDTCAVDSDCAVVFHQVNCCGTLAAWGIAAAGVKDFSAAETICQGQYPDCKCAQLQTTSDDGSKGWAPEDFVAVCDNGQCKSQGASGCHAGLACKDSMFCLSPGASMGCGMCMEPGSEFAPTCTDDASCQGTDPTAVCVDSTIADCLCSPAKLCKPGCTSGTCAEGQTCDASKHCLDTTCAADLDCPTNFVCTTGSCKRRECNANGDCEGFCVNGLCHTAVGTCSHAVPASPGG